MIRSPSHSVPGQDVRSRIPERMEGWSREWIVRKNYSTRDLIFLPIALPTGRLSAFAEFKLTTEDVTRRKLHPGSGAKKTTIKKPDYDSKHIESILIEGLAFRNQEDFLQLNFPGIRLGVSLCLERKSC